MQFLVHPNYGTCVFSAILALRAICVMVTVLPSSSCGVSKAPVGFGGCRDQIISGHTAALFLSAHAISHVTGMKLQAYIYAVLASLVIVVTHAHYTVDVILGAIIATAFCEMKIFV